jgi:hypothetical protein
MIKSAASTQQPQSDPPANQPQSVGLTAPAPAGDGANASFTLRMDIARVTFCGAAQR